jgi:hypothetical protein
VRYSRPSDAQVLKLIAKFWDHVNVVDHHKPFLLAHR